METRTKRALILFVAGTVLGCGGATQSGGGDGNKTAGGEAEKVAWQDMDYRARYVFMTDVVMPEMEPLFREFDEGMYAEFTCESCHGEDGAKVKYKMPNGIAPLKPEKIPLIYEADIPIAKFMINEVQPRMARMLDSKVSTPDSPEGLGCFHCHGKQE